MNPVVAVLVAYFLGGETIGARTIFGTLLVLVSVVVITTTPARKPEAPLVVEKLGEPSQRLALAQSCVLAVALARHHPQVNMRSTARGPRGCPCSRLR